MRAAALRPHPREMAVPRQGPDRRRHEFGADQNGDPNNGPKTTDKWFNTSVFSPAKGAQGTAPRNSVRGPGTRALDLSIFKTFALPRYGALELRVEGFNIFNWAQYSQPHQYTGDSQFGAITGTRLNSERPILRAVRELV